ncbi:MAG: Na/Pi cotransporter family protein [Lachnospiraceae bacterium]|nr:Na/Pi cotransporter family protein [Lachnospiraceae bacterium]
MSEPVQILFGLLGGLAIFLYGMTMMSDNLQRAAGEKMKKILGMLTINPVMGVLSGALVTAVLQSSSATTVMAIGFVSAGLMTLPQAISVIFGANIGTTMTAQLIAFQLSDYVWIIIAAGFLVYFAGKTRQVKAVGGTILGFGLLFLGIETMGTVMKPLAQSPVFAAMIQRVAHIPVLGLLVGCAMTLVAQSSSATIAVLQNVAQQAGPDGVHSVIGLAGAIPVLLGDNIGTTITAVLASLNQTKDAKRTAAAHCIFNLTGSLIFIWFVKPYAALITAISPKGNELEVISRQIANAHTGFNITMTLIWTPLLWLMVKIVCCLIPDRRDETQPEEQPLYLDDRLVGQPLSALHLAAKEILRCSEMVKVMLNGINTLSGKDPDAQAAELSLVRSKSETERKLSAKISDYLEKIFSSGSLSEEQAKQATGIMFILGDIDRISALCGEVAGNIGSVGVLVRRKEENGRKKRGTIVRSSGNVECAGDGASGQLYYSKDAMKDLRKAAGKILAMYTDAMQAITEGADFDMTELEAEKDVVDSLDEKMRQAHMERVSKGKCSPRLTGSFNALLHSLDRIGNSCVNLADMALQQMKFSVFLEDNQLTERPRAAEKE